MDMGLAGKVALVTGGARDVGREIGLALASEGATIAINYRNSKEEANRLVEEIKSTGAAAAAFEADGSDYEAVCTMTDQIVNDFGHEHTDNEGGEDAAEVRVHPNFVHYDKHGAEPTTNNLSIIR